MVGAGIEHECGVGRVVDAGEAEAFDDGQIAVRADVEHARPGGAVPGIGAFAQQQMDRLAGAHDAVIQIVLDAHPAELGDDPVGATGRVGEQDDAFAGSFDGAQAVGSARERLDAIVDDAPEVADEAVVIGGDVGEVLEVPHRAVPTASWAVANPSAAMAASSSRLRRAMTAGPS